MLLTLLIFTHIAAAFIGGFVYRNNAKRSQALLDFLAAKAEEGSEEAKAKVLSILSNLKH